MPVITYRDHLDLIERYGKSNIPIVKVSAMLLLALFITFSFSTGYSSYQNKKIEPQIAQVNYFDTANDSFYKSSQALNDFESSLQVAGVKTEKIDSLKEGSASATTPGFFITLGDIQKSIAQIKATQESIQTQKDQLSKAQAPDVYKTLNNQIMDYFDQAQAFLTASQKTQEQLKDLVQASGPDFYLPILSDEDLWKSQDVDKIKAYYEDKKKAAQAAMESFSKIEVEPELKDYKDTQLSFFQLVINLSDNVNKVLGKTVSQSLDVDSANPTEEAYQVLIGAKRENEIIGQKLFSQRQALTSTEVYQDNLSSLKNRERIIESGLSQGNKAQVVKTDNTSFKMPTIPFKF